MLYILLTINLYAGEWGLYDGLRDADGKRQGLGKMKYDSGNFYNAWMRQGLGKMNVI